MNRSVELLRELILEIEAFPHLVYTPEQSRIEGASLAELRYHMRFLDHLKYLLGSTFGDDQAKCLGLSNRGHNAAHQIRDRDGFLETVEQVKGTPNPEILYRAMELMGCSGESGLFPFR
ncbi:MAG TPA: hypothetical protein VNQ76_21150 [Planctomicrobium sp.]|nr:hypothetical protein [Planctomicrobium sp.]